MTLVGLFGMYRPTMATGCAHGYLVAESPQPRSSGSGSLSNLALVKAALRSPDSHELKCRVLPHSRPVRVVEPLGSVTPASPLNVSSERSLSLKRSKDVSQKPNRRLLRPT